MDKSIKDYVMTSDVGTCWLVGLILIWGLSKSLTSIVVSFPHMIALLI